MAEADDDPGLGADEVRCNVGDTEPVALTVWILPVESPALLPRCDHVSAELRQPIRRDASR
jgi:hypothetical protein